MVPAPSGLQEVDGLNHLLGNPRPGQYSVPRCISHVVLGHVAFYDVHLVLRADVPDQIADPPCHLTAQGRPAILGYPHQMQMDLEYSMRAASVIWHAPSLVNLRRAC